MRGYAAPERRVLNTDNNSYPHALHHLELLQHAEFRSALKKNQYFTEYLQMKQYEHWRTWCVSFRLDDSS